MGWTIPTIIALTLLFFAWKLALEEHRWLRQARTTQGTVVSFRKTLNSKRQTTYYPRISFIGGDGRAHECESSVGSSRPGYKTGEQVLVAYHAETSEGRVLTFGQRFAFPAVLAALGLALLAVVVIFRVGQHYVPRIYLTGSRGW